MTRLIVVSFAIFSVVQPAHAQLSAPPIPSVLPDVSSISRSNAAGVLQYCKSKELVSIARRRRSSRCSYEEAGRDEVTRFHRWRRR